MNDDFEIQCLICGKDYLSSEKACPKCNKTIDEIVAENSKKVTKASKNKTKVKSNELGSDYLCLLYLIGFFFGFGFFSAENVWEALGHAVGIPIIGYLLGALPYNIECERRGWKRTKFGYGICFFLPGLISWVGQNYVP